jgi:parvulin-like peptidyl-prolyl isomerase
LDAQLRQFGSSLAQQKAAFVERALGQSVLQQKINYEPEVTHQEMLTYYHEHQREFERQAQARWEKLTVRSDRLPNKAEAWAALGNIGNEVLRGAPLNAVAKRSSQGVDAADGGYHDWTTQGALASDVLDQAIFSLPVGQLSERLEDKEGFHIVRVIERRDAGRIPFVDAQVEIKEKLKKEKIRKQTEDYVVRLRKEIRVWTIFGDDPAAEVKTATRPDERASPRR